MALIVSSPEYSFKTQQRFFSRHIDPWMPSFCKDLTKTKNAHFYSKVGTFTAAFLAFESRYLSITLTQTPSKR